MLLGYYLCLHLLLSCLNEPVESRTLHLDSCSVHVHTHELRKYYSDMRSDVVSLHLIQHNFPTPLSGCETSRIPQYF